MIENTELPQETTETIVVPSMPDRPFLTTDFADYTVTEGLLLLIFFLLLFNAVCGLIRRWF